MICNKCGTNMADGSAFCPNCGAIQSGMQPYPNMQMGNMGQQYPNMQMGNMGQPYPNMQMGNMGQPYPNMQMGNTPNNPSAPKMPRKKISKKKRNLLIAISSVVALLIAVGVFLIMAFNNMPTKRFLEKRMPDEFLEYTIGDSKYYCDVDNVKIESQTKKLTESKITATVTLDDARMTRKLHYVFVCERPLFKPDEWEIKDYYVAEPTEYEFKDAFGYDLFDNELLFLSSFDNDSVDGSFKFTYDVYGYFSNLDVSGEIIYEGSLEEILEDGEISYNATMDIDRSDLEYDWWIGGIYEEETDGEPTMSFEITRSDDLYHVVFATEKIGVVEEDVVLNSKIDEEHVYGEISFVKACEKGDYAGKDVEYHIELTENDIKAGYVLDGKEYLMDMTYAYEMIDLADPTNVNDNKLVIYYSSEGLCSMVEDYINEYYWEYSDNIESVVWYSYYGGTFAEFVESESMNSPGSLFVTEENFMGDMLETNLLAPVSDCGFDVDAYREQSYEAYYNMGLDNGNLMAVNCLTAPSTILYKSDIAIKVFGTDDPVEIQNYFKDWDTFMETAQTLKDNGYLIVSGPDDIARMMLDMRQNPWQVDGVITLGDEVTNYLDMSKKMYDNGYCGNATMWDSVWVENMGESNVFCYIGPSWFAAYVLDMSDEMEYGSYRSCIGPNASDWGSAYIFYGKECENPALANIILTGLTSDYNALWNFVDEGNCVNHKEFMKSVCEDTSATMGAFNRAEMFAQYDQQMERLIFQPKGKYGSDLYYEIIDAARSYCQGDYATMDSALEGLKAYWNSQYDVRME